MKQSFLYRTIMLLALLFGAMSAASAADRFYVEGANIEPGETKTLSFNLDNDQTFYGFQADITLPEGLEIITNTSGKADVTLSSRCDGSYTTVSNILASGAVRLGAFSTSHTAISGNSAALLYLKVKAADDFVGGTLSISNILFVGANDRDVEFPDYSIVLGSRHSNKLYIPDFKIAVNETKTIGLVLDNETSFTAFQTDVYLPEGLSIVANTVAVTNRASGHSVSAKSFSDGRTRITCFNPNNVNFSGNTGALVEFYITANKDVAETCSIELRNNIFSTTTGSEFVLDNTTTNVTTERALVQSITLDSSTLSLIVGDTWQLNADVQPIFASTRELEWTSSNPDIAIVSSNGVITAIGIGTATITAEAVDGSAVKAECMISVSGVPISSIVLNRPSASLKVTESITLTATVTPANASDKSVIWSSNNNEIATVDENGVVTAHSIGETVISATSVSNPEISAECRITVVPTPVSEIILNQTSVAIQAGATFEFKATIIPETATNKDISWSSVNSEVASIDATGVVTAHALGTTTIIVLAEDGSGISASATVNVIPTPAEGIDIQTPTSTEFKVGESIALTAVVSPDDASDKSIVWASDNNDIATVGTTGIVTAVNVGTVNIKATNSAGISDEITLTVIPTLAESISVLPSQLTLKVNESFSMTVNITPATTTDKGVSFVSSDVEVAIVDEQGNVTALALGETVITARTNDGSNISASCNVTVIPTPVEKVTINYEGPTSLQVGQTAQLAAEVSPEGASDKSIVWEVQNSNVINVSTNGLVTALGLGEAWVRATNSASGISDYIIFTVIPTPVSSINLNASSASLKAGETFTLSATVDPNDATDKSIMWASSNTSVATVSDNGVVKGVSIGHAEITASAIDGSGVSAVCQVEVIPTPTESIKIDQVGPIQMKAGETYQLTATVMPETATDKTVTWSSDAPESVTVDENGLLHAHAVGELHITATNSAGQSDRIVVVVNPTLAQAIKLNRSTAALKVGGTIQLSVIFTPETTTNKNVIWKSSNSSVASVSDQGLVTAHTLGECVVTATALDGSDISTICNVAVGETAAEGISITPVGPVTISVGEFLQLSAEVTPSTTTDKSVSWQTVGTYSDCISVDETGLVTAIKSTMGNYASVCATNSAGQSAYIDIIVPVLYVSSIEPGENKISLMPGQVKEIPISIYPDNATFKDWSVESTNPNVASVAKSYDAKDVYVTALSVGETTIIISTKDGSGVSAFISVSVFPITATGIEIATPETTQLKAGQTLRLSATVTPDDATDKSVIWLSENSEIATVDPYGVVTAVGIGEVNITATNSSGQTASIMVTVVPTLAESLIITNTGVNMHIGEEYQFAAWIEPSTTTNKNLKWTSSNPNIVKIDNNGKATAIELGEAVIEVATTDGSNLTATCPVWVNPVSVEQVIIDYDGTTTLKVGDQIQLNASILPENATDKRIEWFSQTSALTVDQNGLVTAVGLVEQSWIGAFSPASPYGDNPPTDYKFDIINFSVVKTLAERIEILKDNDMMYAGDTKQLTAVVYPESATNKTVTWESSNSSVVTIDVNGLLTAHQTGYSDIKALANDGSGVFATTRIYVAVTPVESITISTNGSTELKDGETVQLTATVSPETATDKSVTWESSNSKVATVSNDGLVTAHSTIGSVRITAKANNGISGFIDITVIETPVEYVSLTSSKETCSVGEIIDINVEFFPANATFKEVTWSVENPDILRIQDYDNHVLVAEALSPGETYVSAKTNNGVMGSIGINVLPILVESISLNKNVVTLNVGETFKLVATVHPDNATDKRLKWVCPSDIASIDDNGLITALKPGVIDIIVYSMDGSGASNYCNLTVYQPVTSISLSEHNISLPPQSEFQLSAAIEPIDASNKSVYWGSSNEEVAMVNANGVIITKSEGETIISVSTLDGSNLTDECNVTVKKDGNGIETVTLDNLEIKIINNKLTVKGISSETAVRLYDVNGRIIATDNSDDDLIIFELFPGSVYILNVGKYSLKVTGK
ncbi:MAG: Ig-like domain-containing protein [Muribaculaceae bacterium]|nr:Ig-like domain-containing protein [Muribaculaceae bacterium]